jgi:Ca2+-binding EF-hand superfamily protein
LAGDFKPRSVLELEGALDGFKYVDLDAEGLSEYRAQLSSLGIRDLGAGNVSATSSASFDSSLTSAAVQIFNMIDTDRSGSITIEEAESVVLKLNSRLSRAYGEVEVKAFFAAASGYSDLISKEQFVKVFVSMTKDE